MALSTFQTFLFFILVSSIYSIFGEAEFEVIEVVNTELQINGTSVMATIDDHFLCATIDWWPASKCNYGTCPWGDSGLLDLDIGNPLLEQTLAGLAPFTIRVGGTLQDLVVYNIGEINPNESCLPFTSNSSALFSYTGGCLHMERWDALNELFMKTGVSVAFGLNALYGRSKSILEHNVIDLWDPSNAEHFIRYTRNQAYPVTAWQLGNELLGAGIGKTVSPKLYAKDIKKLRTIIDNIYQGDIIKPAVIAPDSFYEVGKEEFSQFLKASGPNVVDAITRHIYNLGPGVIETKELISRVLNPIYAEYEVVKYKSLQTLLHEYPKTRSWVGEAGGAYNSGHPEVTDSFIFAFWYLDQLGLASRYNNQAFCRQSFVGGHYGLIDSNFNPNPDYYGALLWQQLMGSGVLIVHIINETNDIRAYAHCQKNNKAGLTLLVLNYSNSTKHHLDVRLLNYSNTSKLHNSHELIRYKSCKANDCLIDKRDSLENIRLEYHMSAPNDTVTSRCVLLNGQPLQMTLSGEIPILLPLRVDSRSPISLEPLTYAYVVIPHAHVPACATL